MESYKNRIITISGDPASGKGSVSKELKKLYEAEGLTVHIISVGEVFRKTVIREYKKRFPEIENPSIEEINSNPDFAEQLRYIDQHMDEEITKIGEEINSKARPNEVFIIDARLGWFDIKDTFAIRLTVDKETAGERVFNDPKRGKEDKYTSLDEAIEDTESRKQEEIRRFMETYGANITDIENFKLVIGTKFASVEDIAKTIKVCEELERQGKPFNKTWASPELLYPTQSIRDTFSSWYRENQMTIRELADAIKEKGIYPDDPLITKTITNSEYQFCYDGHHRILASIIAGNTLVPYKAIGNLEKATVGNSYGLTLIYDHEDRTRRPNGEMFRYAQYPEVESRGKEDDDMWYDDWR